MEYIVVGILFLLVIILGIILNSQSKRIKQLNTTNLEQIKQYYADEYKAAERGFEKDYQALSKSYVQKSTHKYRRDWPAHIAAAPILKNRRCVTPAHGHLPRGAFRQKPASSPLLLPPSSCRRNQD